MDVHLTPRRVFLAHLFMLAVAAATIETLDHTSVTTIREAPKGSLDILKPNGSRAGYGIRRQDGSMDLFRPDGSRLGYMKPANPPGQPGTRRIILQPNRR